MKQKYLLQKEYDEEKELFTKISEQRGIERLKEKGDAWTNIKYIRVYYNSLNQRVIEIQRSWEEEEEEHNFEFGKTVMFFISPSGFNQGIRTLFQGEVSYVDGNRMVVAIPESADIKEIMHNRDAGVMVSFDETTYRAMFEAIETTINAKGRLAELCDIIYTNKVCSFLSLRDMRFPYLNKDQEKAVNMVLSAKDVAVVHGPPGTGKTTTLVEAIYETLRREPQVLVCAQSNMAVDWIAEKLVDRGLNVLRIGNPARVNDKMLSFTYERKFENHSLYPDLWAIRKNIRQLYKEKNRKENWHQKIDRLKSRATELEIRINNELFDGANVITSTLVGSSSRLLQGMKFSTLFIDEAAQALEAAALIPLKRAGRIVFAGDHCQLPPVVKSYEAMKEGLGISLMERIVNMHPESVKLLTMQYRMNDEIMKFSNQWFYQGAMTSAPEVKYRGILDYDTPIEWIDTSDLQENNRNEEPDLFKEIVAGNYGKINKDEALFTLLQLQNYIERIGIDRILEENIDIGIISPYRAQTQYLRQLIKSIPFFKPVRQLISINTVDGFQGRERDIIIISMVRSNDEGNIGFLRDLRRMNVAMTRARMKLIIIGDSGTLTRHKFYRDLFQYIHK